VSLCRTRGSRPGLHQRDGDPDETPGLLDAFQASAAENDPSPGTLQTLRNLDLEVEYRRAPGAAYARLQAACVHDPQPDMLLALAEMSYLFGKQNEKRKGFSPGRLLLLLPDRRLRLPLFVRQLSREPVRSPLPSGV